MNELEFLINPSYQNIIKNVPNKVEKKKNLIMIENFINLEY